jgi:hypothetical protein
MRIANALVVFASAADLAGLFTRTTGGRTLNFVEKSWPLQ